MRIRTEPGSSFKSLVDSFLFISWELKHMQSSWHLQIFYYLNTLIRCSAVLLLAKWSSSRQAYPSFPPHQFPILEASMSHLLSNHERLHICQRCQPRQQRTPSEQAYQRLETGKHHPPHLDEWRIRSLANIRSVF
jgi:hypothetical protein